MQADNAPPSPMTAPPLFVVFNLASGRGDRDEVRREIESACAAHGRRAELLTVDSPDRLMEIAEEAVRRAQAEGGVVVAAGGDGTLSAVAQATLGSGCAYGVLPRGTFNYFSRTHGISAEIGEAMRTLLEESPRPVQVGLVNGRAFLVNASLGLYPQLLEDRETWKQQFGRSRLVALGAGIVTLLKGHRSLRLAFDAPDAPGAPRDLRTPTLFVGNNALQMEQVGLPESHAIDQGRLAGVAVRPVGRMALLTLLFRGLLGRLGAADELVDFSFKRLTVQARRFGGRRVKVATDGEIVWMNLPLTFEVAPQPLMLIRPAGLAPERAAEQAS
ncbi:Diacylglycerol kinase family enzyme [Roseateles sp. YR242]|uniref:diacylglycerol/lipid kinase family protein n=1 Tax=Roseateles sp. YR242 TaxID=1855305 RepID=UPI0008B245F7|nr:diacylglycerol kinase family protein [Roseateles sp. YR242]SEL45057.1 Diacylglycerol kinase family enzyme [Roseateles sp. YR242]